MNHVKFLLSNGVAPIDEAKYVHLMDGLPRAGEVIWFEEQPSRCAWRVEYVRHVIGQRGVTVVEVKISEMGGKL
jgi:hypothetical protein